MNLCDRKRLLKLFQRLVSMDAPTFEERAMADMLTVELESLGFTVEEDEAGKVYGGNAGNLYAYRKGTLPGTPLLFSTHMDTVEPARGKRAVLHEDGKITSEGTTVLGADCMAGTAAILEALQEISEEGLPCRDVEILFTIGEEKHLRGSAVFDYSRVQSKESYILDLSGPVGTAACQAPTLVDFQISVHGKSAHAGFAPEKGVHAIAVAAKAIASMELGHVGDSMTVNIGAVQGGGKTTNIVPDYCELIGEVRSFSHEDALEQMKKIEALFQREAELAGGSCEMKAEVSYHAYQTEDEHVSIQRFRRACETLGLPGIITRTFGGSDQANLAQHGIKGLVLSSGMSQVHTCQEYVMLPELEKLTELVKLLMQDDEG